MAAGEAGDFAGGPADAAADVQDCHPWAEADQVGEMVLVEVEGLGEGLGGAEEGAVEA